MSDRLKYRVAEHIAELLTVEAQERMGPLTEIHGAEVHAVGPLLIQLWIPREGSGRQLIEIKVSEPVA